MANETTIPEFGVNRRAMLGAAALAPLAAASLLPSMAHAAGSGSTFPDHPRWKFVFVNHVTTNPFFVPTQYGIQDACGLLGCDFQWSGSANADVGEMVNAVNAAIASKASAIAVPIVDPHAFDQPIAKALAAGIPVFSYNADAPVGGGNRRLAYIGQDLYKSGEAMGQRILSLVDSGPIVMFIATPGQLNIQPRLDGAASVIKASGKNITIETVATGPTLNEELSKVKAYYLGHPNVKGMFAVDGGSTQSIAQTMKQYGLAAKGVRGGGYDLLPLTLQLINEGHLDFTIDQQPYLQGFYTSMQMFTFLASGGLVGPAECNTGLKFVTKASVAPYLSTQTRFEGNTETAKIVPVAGAI